MGKIVLGTAQFGLDYGINNKRGKIAREEVFEILAESLRSGIDVLDTAYSYGDSETLIGDFLRKSDSRLKIVSKLPKCDPLEVEKIFFSSLQHLNIDSIYGYMIHSFQHYLDDPGVWDELKKLRSQGKIERIGISLYFPAELDLIFSNNIDIDIVQLPYSIFDRRFEPYLQELREKGVETFIRSVFLQGLVFKNPSELDDHFAKIRTKIVDLNSLSERLEVPIVSLCLNFALLNKFVDRVVVGIDGIDNLKEIIRTSDHISIVQDFLPELHNFRENDENIILPINWKVKAK